MSLLFSLDEQEKIRNLFQQKAKNFAVFFELEKGKDAPERGTVITFKEENPNECLKEFCKKAHELYNSSEAQVFVLNYKILPTSVSNSDDPKVYLRNPPTPNKIFLGKIMSNKCSIRSKMITASFDNHIKDVIGSETCELVESDIFQKPKKFHKKP